MKNIRLILLLVTITLSFYMKAATVITIDGIVYSISGKNASVQGIAPDNTETKITIPSVVSYQGIEYSVTEIGQRAFSSSNANNINIQEIILPNTITKINWYAFNNKNITNVKLCEGITEIGNGAFKETSIKFMHLPEGIEKIGYEAFAKSALTKIIIPKSLKTFELGGSDKDCANTFFGCDFLRTIIYLSVYPPKNWTATSQTYVPWTYPKQYKPFHSINNANIIEMVTFSGKTVEAGNKVDFRKKPELEFINNVEDYSLEIEVLDWNTEKEPGYTSAEFTGKFTSVQNAEETFEVYLLYNYIMKRGKLTVTAKDVVREYGDSNPEFTLLYEGFENNDTENSLYEVPIAYTTAKEDSEVGSYPIYVKGGDSDEYDFIYVPGTLTITSAPLTIKVADSNRTYGQKNPQFELLFSGLKNGESTPNWKEYPTFITDAKETSGIGDYNVNVSCEPTNYDSSIESGTLTIKRAPLTIKANDATRKYFESEPPFTFSCEGFVNNDDVSVLTKVPSFSTDAAMTNNVGNYKITPCGAEAKNYTISYEQGELTITKRQLKVSSHCSRLYGEENSSLPIEYIGFVNNETENVIVKKPIATTGAKKTSSVGEYPITLSGGEATNYDFVYEQGMLEITKAPLSAKVNDATRIYGTQNPTFTIDYYGLKNNESVPAWNTRPTFQTDATQSSGVGHYTVNAVNGVPVNYELEAITAGTLEVTPAPLTIKANDTTRLYYSDEPNFSYTCNGFVNDDNESVLTTKPVLSTTATRTSNAGDYEIKVGETSTPNYSISYVNGTLTITPRTLTASVGNYERVYNEENPVFEVMYDGFVNDEDESVIVKKPTVTCVANLTTDVGKYPITLSGAESDNYTFNYKNGELTINIAEQEIIWNQKFENIQVGDQIEIMAYATSGLPIDYTLNDNSLASLYSANGKQYLDCMQEGTLVIRAFQEGNNNYYAAVRKTKTIFIGNSNGIDVLSTKTSEFPVYDMMGNKVEVMVKGRMYISNGKKIVAK